MLSFLQGFAIGLAIMTGPWLLAGLLKPEWVLPDIRPNRLKVFFRYGMAVPFTSLVLGLTSLWGGFGASLMGWLSGLGVLFIAVPLERKLRRFLHHRKLQKMANTFREQLDVNLEKDASNDHADSITKQLNAVRTQLLKLKTHVEVPERFYSRYAKLQHVLAKCFQPQELAMQRAQALIKDVYQTSLRQMDRFVDLHQQFQMLDLGYIQRQLSESHVTGVTRDALKQRQQLANSLQQEIHSLQAEFEKTLTALDSTRLKLSNLQGTSSSNTELENVLGALDRFNQRVSQYAPSKRSENP